MTLRKISKKQSVKNKEKASRTEELHQLFLDIWDEREDEEGYVYCFETGKHLYGPLYRGNTCCYDHVLEKSKYPQYAMNRKNIVILHPDVHAQKTQSIDRTPRVKKYREELLSLHEEEKLED